ncbi:MAG: acetoacetate decarboxylase family protein [Halioglobus sp.]|nr:acetoacetate decarboxylase family protein [Halioglobus sp.]
MTAFGDDLNPRGALSIYGAKPNDSAFQYEGPLWHQDLHILFYTTTHEAIAKVLPNPLEPNYDLPPVCMAVSWQTEMRLADGRNHNYVGISLNPACRFKEVSGQCCVFEYVDGIDGDKTAGAEIVQTIGINMGCNKKLGNITRKPDGNEHVMTCERRGQPLIEARFRNFKHVEDISPVFAENPALAAVLAGRSLGVREIPKPNHNGFDIRSVVAMGHAMGNISEISLGEGSLELWHGETDPVDLLEVVEYGPAIHMKQSTGSEVWTNTEELERLPTD